MKITIELNLENQLDICAGRRTAVWLLGMLPEDEARLAMQTWARWSQAEDAAEAEAAEDKAARGAAAARVARELSDAADEVVPEQAKQPAPRKVEPEIVGAIEDGETPERIQVVETHPQVIKAEPAPTTQTISSSIREDVRVTLEHEPVSKPSYDNFTFGSKKYSVRKTGPSRAMKDAVMEIALADRADLEQLHSRLSGLKGIFHEIGRDDLAAEIDTALGKRMAELPEAREAQDLQDLQEVQEQQQSLPAPGKPIVLVAGTLEWDGQQVRPVLARALVLKQIERCVEIEQLDAITDAVDRLADQLQDLGSVAYANEVRAALTARMDVLVDQEDAAPAKEPQERAGPPAPRAANGGGTAAADEPLRLIMRRYDHQHGRPKALALIKAHTGGKKTELNQLTQAEEAAVRAAALAGLAG